MPHSSGADGEWRVTGSLNWSVIHRAGRDMLALGLGGWAFIVQVRADADRPLLLAVTCALLGLPIVMRSDEKHEQQAGGECNDT